jgi:UDP-glucose:(heptosyl)LPS alpha-1,3-glucosyltransferase
VTTPKCGVAELLRDGENGFIRDALDTAGLADALGRLDPASAARLGANALESVKRFTPEAMAREYVALYRRLLHR